MTLESLPEILGRTGSAVSSRLTRVFHELEGIASKIDSAADTMPTSPRRAEYSFLKPLFEDLLLRNTGLIDGAGIAYGPDSLSDVKYWIEWWRIQKAGRPKFISHDLNPRSIRYYDYSARDWFKVPTSRGGAVAIGPYVDMGGISINTVTLTVPVPTKHGSHVLGCDLSLAALEELFLQAVGTLDPTVVLIGSNTRVIASNSPKLVIGTLANLGKASINIPLDSESYGLLPWNLVVFAP